LYIPLSEQLKKTFLNYCSSSVSLHKYTLSGKNRKPQMM
jgi:hypothetical protein